VRRSLLYGDSLLCREPRHNLTVENARLDEEWSDLGKAHDGGPVLILRR
jgi:hypothetical protein